VFYDLFHHFTESEPLSNYVSIWREHLQDLKEDDQLLFVADIRALQQIIPVK
jgi:hypothetical protein